MQIVELINKDLHSKEWLDVLNYTDEEPTHQEIGQSWEIYLFKKSGLEVRYSENDKFEGIREIWVYGNHYDDIGAFKGEVIAGLTTKDNRAKIKDQFVRLKEFEEEESANHFCSKLKKPLISDTYSSSMCSLTFYFLEHNHKGTPVYICAYC